MYKPAFLAITALLAAQAYANDLHYEVGYTTVSNDSNNVNVTLGGVYGAVGYELHTVGNYTSEIEGLIILGVTDDNIGPVNIELNTTTQAAYRGTLKTANPDFDVFWRASYTRVELDANGNFNGGFSGGSETVDSSGLGLGFGAEWKNISVGYSQYFGDLEDISRINIGFRF